LLLILWSHGQQKQNKYLTQELAAAKSALKRRDAEISCILADFSAFKSASANSIASSSEEIMVLAGVPLKLLRTFRHVKPSGINFLLVCRIIFFKKDEYATSMRKSFSVQLYKSMTQDVCIFSRGCRILENEVPGSSFQIYGS
jgi:hypothetical protein